jgi:hypothetical protein
MPEPWLDTSSWRVRVSIRMLCARLIRFTVQTERRFLLGYFRADKNNAGNALPGSHIFCAVSHDIIAHETTHALLDGLHRRYQEPTNPDVLAVREAFADIVAIFQHFTMPEALHPQIRRTRGDLSQQDSPLAKLAIQFAVQTMRM